MGGHLSRVGTKEDVQTTIDYMDHILEGCEYGVATVGIGDIIMGTGTGDPANPNAGNNWYDILTPDLEL